jgi:hypothetical protein
LAICGYSAVILIELFLSSLLICKGEPLVHSSGIAYEK